MAAIEPDDDVGITIGESAGVYSDHDVPSEWWEIDLSNGDGCMEWVIGLGAQRGGPRNATSSTCPRLALAYAIAPL